MTLAVIPTAGFGSRLGKITQHLNKSLLPYKDKPVLSHIFERFPKDTTFVIPVGYLGQQVRDFCQSAHSELDIIFVDIDDYSSRSSGPGYTIRQCFNLINQPFWYIPCDTYFDEMIPKEPNNNLIFVKTVPSAISSEYTTFTTLNDKIETIKFKEFVNYDCLAFTGLMYIYDFAKFKQDLESAESPEVITGIKAGNLVRHLSSWKDLGSLSNYETALKETQKYNFTKDNEITYICNNKVIKWWKDENIPIKKESRYQTNPSVFPLNTQRLGNFLSYDYFDGDTIYKKHNINIIKKLLSWLDKEVWIPVDLNLKSQARDFYQNKTDNRIQSFLTKYPNLPVINFINGRPVKPWKHYYENINWQLLTEEIRPGFIHGDLQFDNIIVSDNEEFKIIDWRYEFSSSVIYGDIYYDLGKLLGGLIINYSQIKENNFNIDIQADKIKLQIPYVDNYRYYKEEILTYAKENGFNLDKIMLLVPLIFWNMSPLHTPPFDKFLWYLGILLFEEYDNER